MIWQTEAQFSAVWRLHPLIDFDEKAGWELRGCCRTITYISCSKEDSGPTPRVSEHCSPPLTSSRMNQISFHWTLLPVFT